jgi:hypothetical protein
MHELGHHVVLNLRGRRLLAPTAPARRELARIVIERGRGHGLLAFAAPDTHLHLVTTAGRSEAGELARSVAYAIQRRLRPGAAFERSWLEGITSHGHLHRTALYALRQHERHRVREDPHRDASLLPDLLGLRVLGTDLVATVEEALPRLHEGELLAAAGWGELDLGAWVESTVGLADAAAAAAGRAHLEGGRGEAAAARRAAVAVGLELTEPAEVSRLLGLTDRAVRKLRAEAPDPPLVRAIRRQLALRAALRRRQPQPFRNVRPGP